MSRKDVTDEMIWRAAAQYRDASQVFLNRAGRGPAEPLLMVDELLMQWTGQPRKVVERAMERAASRGVIDYGVSLRTCWPERYPTSAQTDHG